MRFLTDLRRDVALGIRLLVRCPGFSAVSIATLAVAIGGNTAVVTIVNALLLTPPAVVEPARLARRNWPWSVGSRRETVASALTSALPCTSARIGDALQDVAAEQHPTLSLERLNRSTRVFDGALNEQLRTRCVP